MTAVDARNTMWCGPCKQDVRGVASATDGNYRCPRCAEVLDARAPARSAPDGAQAVESRAGDPGSRASGAKTRVLPPPLYDGWEADEQLRHIDSILRKESPPSTKQKAAHNREILRLDQAHAVGGRHRPPVRKPIPTTHPSGAGSAALTWTALSLGITTLVCGSVLLGWSLVTDRADLWAIGTPIALVGLVGLLIGLILQLDRLWQDNRRAVTKLDRLDNQLHDLRTTTSLLSTTHSSPATAFYAHMAEGANPQLLLADLKGQLDLLSVRLGQDRGE